VITQLTVGSSKRACPLLAPLAVRVLHAVLGYGALPRSRQTRDDDQHQASLPIVPADRRQSRVTVSRVPLLLVDLDNTLIDRAGAFVRWAREFASAQGGGAADAEWLVAADRDGFESREQLTAMIARRFGLDSGEAGLLDELRAGLVRHIIPDEAVTVALREARAAGWVPFVVTNGTVEQQERKLRHTGLDREVAGWVISEGVGMRKPDPEIFRLAAAQAGQPLNGAWMIGDSAEADIGGACDAGLPGVWLHRGRPWPLTAFQPSRTADSFPGAVGIVLAAGS
jgi:putative hydrolase of the HAD superfamily